MTHVMRLVPPLLMTLAILVAINLARPLFDLSRSADAKSVCDRAAQALNREPAASVAHLFLAEDLADYLGKPSGANAHSAEARTAEAHDKDPWGTPYRLEHFADGVGVRLRSAGPDRVFDSTDDIFSR